MYGLQYVCVCVCIRFVNPTFIRMVFEKVTDNNYNINIVFSTVLRVRTRPGTRDIRKCEYNYLYNPQCYCRIDERKSIYNIFNRWKTIFEHAVGWTLTPSGIKTRANTGAPVNCVAYPSRTLQYLTNPICKHNNRSVHIFKYYEFVYENINYYNNV